MDISERLQEIFASPKCFAILERRRKYFYFITQHRRMERQNYIYISNITLIFLNVWFEEKYLHLFLSIQRHVVLNSPQWRTLLTTKVFMPNNSKTFFTFRIRFHLEFLTLMENASLFSPFKQFKA